MQSGLVGLSSPCFNCFGGVLTTLSIGSPGGWEYQQEGTANSRLAVVVTRYVHEVMMPDKKQFYSGNILAKMFRVPSSTLNKLISERKYMGGAELEKHRDEMECKGVHILKRRDTKIGGRNVSEQPKPGTSSQKM